MSNNNNNVYKLKYVAHVEFDDKTIGIKKEVSKNLQRLQQLLLLFKSDVRSFLLTFVYERFNIRGVMPYQMAIC